MICNVIYYLNTFASLISYSKHFHLIYKAFRGKVTDCLPYRRAHKIKSEYIRL